MAATNQFDVILMDMYMPVMDGFTATKQLRKMGCTAPIIALTANVTKVDERKCLAAGCTRFLSKPIDMDRLTTTLAELLGAADETQVERHTRRKVDQLTSDDHPIDAVATPADDEVGLCEPVHAAVTDLAHELNTESPIFTSLPTDDDEFREIVAGFVDRLGRRVAEMRVAFENGDLEALADLAHWLKGAGGMVGFEPFTAPAASMQENAENGRTAEVAGFLREIEAIARRVQHPDADPQLATTTGDALNVFHSAQTEEVI
jgi:HPt (histidine-containing phosphotransfer) domain-containing protein